MTEIFSYPVFGIFLTLLAFAGAVQIKRKWNYIFFNPVFLAIAFIIIFLLSFNIKYGEYNNGGKFLSFFLGPAVVALGVFFYEKYAEVKQNLKPLLIAVTAGGISGIFSVIIILILFKAPIFIVQSLSAKSVTAPIAIEISKLIGGVPEITAGMVIVTGIFGNAFGPLILRFLGITNTIAIGTSLGTAAHAIGTARAFEEGKLPGVYSGLAMCLNGIVTALLAPYICLFLV